MTCIPCTNLDRTNQHRLSSCAFSTTYDPFFIKDNFSIKDLKNRKYTCIYNDSDCSLSIAHNYDEILLEQNFELSVTGEWIINNGKYEIHLYVSINSQSDNDLSCETLGLILEALADSELSLLEKYPHLGKSRIIVYFNSPDDKYDRAENWHSLKYWTQDYKKSHKKKQSARLPPQMCPACKK